MIHAINRHTGRLWGGQYVFLAVPPAEVDDYLEFLGLFDDVWPSEDLDDRRSPSIFLAHDGTWLHVIDDLYYMLFHSTSFARHLRALTRAHDVFRFVLPDSDNAYSFHYHRGGELVRELVVASPDMRAQVVVRDFGAPFPVELEHEPRIRANDPDIFLIAAALGIETDWRKLDVQRCVFQDPDAFRRRSLALR